MQRDHRSGLYQPDSSSAPLPRWKRPFDVCCGIAALPLLGLLSFGFGIVALTLSRGPVFFCQEKIGYKGRRIRLYRFRTMHVRSSATIEWSRRGALALIPGGQFLRDSGLARLPQVINVLRGEMSVVGPRPW